MHQAAVSTITRRGLGALLLTAALAPRHGRADEGTTVSHAIAVLGTPALPADFPYFPYVNPEAPKGGEVTLGSMGTYDSFNPFVLRGTAEGGVVAPWVTMPGGSGSGSTVGHIWESLLTSSADEVATGYCHVAQSLEMPHARMWIAFNIRPEARYSDGKPIAADDIVWTYHTLLDKGLPGFRIQLADVAEVRAEGPRRVLFRFKSNTSRALPVVVGGLPILPQHFFEGRDFTKPLTDPPIGSGPYRITKFDLGRSVTFERDPNWWARDRPTGRGTNNFDRVRIEFYREAAVAMEAFKGGQVDLRSENISKTWATGYDFPAVKDGLVIKAEIRHHLPTGMQGWSMNTRREIFSNRLVRRAMAEAFNFEWANKNLFYGAYTRLTSYFSNSDLASSGVPEGAELALLEPYRKELPPELLTEPFRLPVNDASGNDRHQLLKAMTFLEAAGWRIKGMQLVNAKGEQMRFTILLPDPSFERVALPYVDSLKHLGIEASVRTVDPAQYQRLIEDFDFDMTMTVFPESDVPGNELRDFFSCAASKAQGSSNVPGVCSVVVDALVEKVIAAQDRDTLRTAARALDRVLLWGYYLVPNWASQSFHIAYWNRFGNPGKPIREGFNFDIWWVDAKKAAATDAARKSGG